MNRKRALVAKAPKDYKLLWMAMPFIVIVFLFSYVPIFGWIYSFFDYVPGVSIFDCDFVGLDYFKLIFNDDNVLRSLKNTFIFALINICLTPLPMFMAILLNELRNGPIKKFTQTFTTLPNFISWVIIFSLATALFASDGIVTGLATALGIEMLPIPCWAQMKQYIGSSPSCCNGKHWDGTPLSIWQLFRELTRNSMKQQG